MHRPQRRQRDASSRDGTRQVDKTQEPSGLGPRRSAVGPSGGVVAVAKRPEVLDVEANLWL